MRTEMSQQITGQTPTDFNLSMPALHSELDEAEFPELREQGDAVRPGASSLGVRTHLAEIGELIDLGTHWRMVYDACGHTQEFAREALEKPERAAYEVRRQYAACLTCRTVRSPRHFFQGELPSF